MSENVILYFITEEMPTPAYVYQIHLYVYV